MNRGRASLLVLTVITMLGAVVTGALAPRDFDTLPDGFEAPVLALELARSPDDASLVIEGNGHRAALLSATIADLGFIAAYATLWTVMASSVHPLLAVAAALAGFADLVEDAGIFAALLAAPTGPVVTWIRCASLVKWALLGITFVGLYWYFRPPGRVNTGWDVMRLGTGLVYAYAGVLCVWGVAIDNPVIERSMLPLSFALVMQIILAAAGRMRSASDVTPSANPTPVRR